MDVTTIPMPLFLSLMFILAVELYNLARREYWVFWYIDVGIRKRTDKTFRITDVTSRYDLALEIGYLIASIYLLFTPVWFFGIGLIGLGILKDWLLGAQIKQMDIDDFCANVKGIRFILTLDKLIVIGVIGGFLTGVFLTAPK